LFVPASLALLHEFFDWVGGAIITGLVLALPLIVASGSNYFPFGGVNADVNTGNYDAALAKLASSRGRPRGGFEFKMWLFMRGSGIVIIFLALFHMFLMHFVINVETMSYQTIVERWTGWQGAFWRTYDLFLLVFAFTHGINGARNVLEDYFHSPGWRAFLIIGLWLFWFLLMVMGAFVIFTFNPVQA